MQKGEGTGARYVCMGMCRRSRQRHWQDVSSAKVAARCAAPHDAAGLAAWQAGSTHPERAEAEGELAAHASSRRSGRHSIEASYITRGRLAASTDKPSTCSAGPDLRLHV